MAKKKKSKGRRKVGAASSLNPKSPLIKVAAVAAGYLLGDKINDVIAKVIPKKTVTAATATTPAITAPIVSDTILGAAETGLGALLLLKGKPSLVKTAAGGLLAGAGLKKLLSATGIIKGYQSVPVIGGYQRTPVLGSRTPAQLQGAGQNPMYNKRPAQLQGYRVNGYTPNGSGAAVMGSLFTQDSGSGITNPNNGGYMN